MARSTARLAVVVPTPRQRIIDAALDLMAEHGFDGMSLQMVADRVGLHKSTLFHHFKGKEELAREELDGVSRRLLERIEPLLSTEAPELEQILRASDAMVDHFAEERSAARSLVRLMVASPDFVLAVGSGDHPVDRLLIGLTRWLDRARRAGAIRPVKVRHTLLNVMGIALFYPATAHAIGAEILAADPWSDEALRSRKRELRAFLRGALEAE
jgi:AcrR family transcriptional regulator